MPRTAYPGSRTGYRHATARHAIARLATARLATAGLAAAGLVAAVALVAGTLSLGLGLLDSAPDDSHGAVAVVVVDDAIATVVLPAAVTLFVLALVTFVLENTRLRPSLHRPVAARDRSPPSTIGI
jgi:hypothetical protein